MSQTKFTYQDTRAIITASGLNSLFENLADATDGTIGKIDPDNVRTEGFNRNHFKNSASPNLSDDEIETNDETYGYNGALTGVWTTIWDKPVNLTIGANEVLRVHFNPLVTLTSRQNTGSVIVRANSAFYIQHYITVGGVDVAIGAPFGYNTIVAGDGNTGNSANKTLFNERLPSFSIFMPNIQTVVTSIKTKIYFDDAANYKVTFKWLYGLYVHHKY